MRDGGIEEGIEFVMAIVVSRAAANERPHVVEESAQRPHQSSPREALRMREIADV